MPLQWTIGLVSAVALPRTLVALSSLQDRFVVILDYPTHTRHARVAQFYSVPVEDLV